MTIFSYTKMSKIIPIPQAVSHTQLRLYGNQNPATIRKHVDAIIKMVNSRLKLSV